MSPFSSHLVDLAAEALSDLRTRDLRLTTAESCTGGLISAVLTEIPGSSSVVGRAFVTYSNEAKEEVLGVSARTLAKHGAVSAETVVEMAEGALRVAGSDADVAIAVSGVAGPHGGSDAKPVGTVFIAVAHRGADSAWQHRHFAGDRAAVRIDSVAAALELVRDVLAVR